METKPLPAERLDQWAARLKTVQQAAGAKQTLSFVIGAGVLVAVTLLVYFATSAASFCGPAILALAIAAVATWALLTYWAKPARLKAVEQLSSEIRQTCEAEGFSKTEVVESLTTRVTAGKVGQEVLSAVEPEQAAVATLRKRSQPFFQKGVAGKESDALTFRALTLDYLASKLYTEAVAALGMTAAIYGEIAPAFADGINIDQIIQFTPDATKRMELATRKVLSSFDFEPELKAIVQTGVKRRQMKLLDFLLKAQEQGAESTPTLQAASEAFKPVVRDADFVGACVDYIGPRATKWIPALHALVAIPDVRTVPHLLKVFDILAFYPQGIDAIIQHGEAVHAQLLEALRTGSVNVQFNVALALGVMEVEAARPVFKELLAGSLPPRVQIACCYGLAKLGETEYFNELIQMLAHSDADVRHAAAIALEHLNTPLAADVYARHMTDAEMLVRLRLTRKMGAQGLTDPALVPLALGRFEDATETVRSEAVETVVKFGAEQVYDRLVDLTKSTNSNARLCAYQALGKLGQSQAVALLQQGLQGFMPAETRRAVIGALGDLKAEATADALAGYLNDKELGGAAFWALLQIGFQNADTGKRVLGRHPDRLQKLFALAVLGDESAKRQLKGMLSATGDIRQIAQAADYARILSDAEFEQSLRSLLNYTNQQFAPTDKLIPYTAFKALIHILLAKP